MSDFVRIGKKFTIVIPKRIREKLGLSEGQLSEIRVDKDRLIITPKHKDPFKRLEEIIGDIKYEKSTEKRAEKWLLKER